MENCSALARTRSVESSVPSLEPTPVFPLDTWIRRHLQIIFFGRQHCPALRHDLAGCPICSWAATKARLRAR